MKSKSCFIMGLPEAGKTTYLAALWHSIAFKDKTALQLKHLTGDQSYLNGLSQTWISAEKVSRTTIHSEKKTLSMLLVDSKYQQFEVTFPDLSGESFQKQYRDREIDIDLKQYIHQCDGILLFVNSGRIVEPSLISEIPYKARHSDDISENEIFSSRNPINDDPTDVQLVELLQFINFLKDCNHTRLGIIISAWDIISTDDKPEDFAKARLPLLWQYLSANSKIFNTFYYGVSAQGSSYENKDDSDKLLAYDEPMDRIIVVDNKGNKSHDITLPLWETLKEGEGEAE